MSHPRRFDPSFVLRVWRVSEKLVGGWFFGKKTLAEHTRVITDKLGRLLRSISRLLSGFSFDYPRPGVVVSIFLA